MREVGHFHLISTKGSSIVTNHILHDDWYSERERGGRDKKEKEKEKSSEEDDDKKDEEKASNSTEVVIPKRVSVSNHMHPASIVLLIIVPIILFKN